MIYRSGVWTEGPGEGIDYASLEYERLWLPVVGPTAWLVVRRLARELAANGGEEIRLATSDLARDMGVQVGKTKTTIDRAANLGLMGVLQRGAAYVVFEQAPPPRRHR